MIANRFCHFSAVAHQIALKPKLSILSVTARQSANQGVQPRLQVRRGNIHEDTILSGCGSRALLATSPVALRHAMCHQCLRWDVQLVSGVREFDVRWPFERPWLHRPRLGSRRRPRLVLLHSFLTASSKKRVHIMGSNHGLRDNLCRKKILSA